MNLHYFAPSFVLEIISLSLRMSQCIYSICLYHAMEWLEPGGLARGERGLQLHELLSRVYVLAVG